MGYHCFTMDILLCTGIFIACALSAVHGFFCGRLPQLYSPRMLKAPVANTKAPALVRNYASVLPSVELGEDDFLTLEADYGPRKETKIEIYPNGDRYEGEFFDGKRHGHGVQYFARVGKSLTGEFRKGKIYSGKGTLFIAKTNNLYKGTWERGLFTGYAEYDTVHSNDIYHFEGSMVNGEKCGYGTLTYPSGQVYLGNFELDMRHGQGKVVCRSGNTAQGEFHKDRLHNGTGTMELAHGLTFTGIWESGWWQGPGKLTTGDGLVYEGTYDRGRLCGPGYVTYPDGHKYKGTFTNGIMVGGVRVVEEQMNVGIDGDEVLETFD